MLHAEQKDERAIILAAIELAERYEDAPVLPVVRITATGLTWSAVDVTGYADYGQRVRIVLDKEG